MKGVQVIGKAASRIDGRIGPRLQLDRQGRVRIARAVKQRGYETVS